ncbi:hypothetical protein ccbrp13_31030 [Ktedonobacteria bacterium brp13]|nr:hypothetical protein ccbrp13_31030 [Ktedonobacteria bacterium brp13]
MLLTQLIIRMFFIDFYIILSPIGIAASALPGRSGQSLTRLWLSGFLSSIFVQFLQVVALIVIEVLIAAMFSSLRNLLDPNFISNANLELILKIAALWFIVRIPSLLGTAPMSTMVQTGQAMTQAATAIATTQIAEVQAGMSAASSAGGAVAMAFM